MTKVVTLAASACGRKEFLPEAADSPLPGWDHAVRKCAGVQGDRGIRQCFRAWPSGTPPGAR